MVRESHFIDSRKDSVPPLGLMPFFYENIGFPINFGEFRPGFPGIIQDTSKNIKYDRLSNTFKTLFTSFRNGNNHSLGLKDYVPLFISLTKMKYKN